MLHIPPTNLLLLPAKQEPYKKAYLLSKILKNFLGKKSGVGQQAEKGKTERRHQTSPASLRGTKKAEIYRKAKFRAVSEACTAVFWL